MVVVRYESLYQNSCVSFFVNPFEIGCRHLLVAFCNGTEETLTKMAKERMIYRAEEGKKYNLTIINRVVHLVVGLMEIFGYCAIIVPFAVAFFDRMAGIRTPPKDMSYLIRVHYQEWGSLKTKWKLIKPERRNPFGPLREQDPFYKDASWMTKKTD